MSNSIWKMPEETPKDFCDVVLANFRTGSCSVFLSPFHNGSFDYDKWCYLTDLIAQADKAERLQKAVDLAQERLLSISDGYDIMKADAETIKRLFYAIQDEASETYKETKQLIEHKE